MYNLIHTSKEYQIGDMFDRFGRNSLYQRDVFRYNLLSIDEVDEERFIDDKNIILGDNLHTLIKHSKKIRKYMPFIKFNETQCKLIMKEVFLNASKSN